MSATPYADAAAIYARMGFAVIALAPGTKLPLAGSKGVFDATTDLDVIARIAAQSPGANVGIACGAASSNLLVVDIDPRNGGAETLAKFLRDTCTTFDGPMTETRSGGNHYLFDGTNMPATFKKTLCQKVVVAGNKKPSSGIDIKWTGGYIVAPPSMILPGVERDGQGGAYRWIRKPLGPLPPVPRALRKALEIPPPPRVDSGRRLEPSEAKLKALAEEARRHGQGNRNNVLYWASRRAEEEIAAGAYGQGEAYAALYSAGLELGLQTHEVDSVLRLIRPRS